MVAATAANTPPPPPLLLLPLLLMLLPSGVPSPASGDDRQAMEPRPLLLAADACGAYGPVQNQTDITGGKILSGFKPHVVTPSSAACCGRCLSEAPAADAWVREDGTGYCWCVQGATGTKPRSSRSCGRRGGPGPLPPPPPPPPSIPGPLPPPAVLRACEAAVTMDPQGTTQHGANFESATLAANSTAVDCSFRCCQNWDCAAFSFEVSTQICTLRSGVLPLIHNSSHSGGVVSGVLGQLAAPEPPFNESAKFFSNVSFAEDMSYGTEGDTWPTTWLADNTQLTAAGDRGDMWPKSHMSMWRVDGSPRATGPPKGQPSAFTMDNIGGEYPVNISQFCGSLHSTGGRVGVKPTSLLSVDGDVYWGITCMNYGDEPLFKRQHNYYAWIAKATDTHGAGWDFTTTSTHFFTGRLAAPMFIQYGQDYQDAVDGFVYAHFPYATDQYTGGAAQSFWNNNDDVLLGRVPKSDILDRSRWEFWRGSGDWTSDEAAAVSVMHYPQMLGMNQVNFHRPSGRYLLANYGFIDLDGRPRPWHQQPEVKRHRTQLMLFEAPQPWGPFFRFHRDDDWRSPDGAGGGYCPVFPPKWMGATTAWIVSAQCCAKGDGANGIGPNPHHYNFSAQRVDFSFEEEE